MPPLIFLNRLGIFSSSKGRLPHSSAYRMTPQLHTSTSGPAYSLPDMTCRGAASTRTYGQCTQKVLMHMKGLKCSHGVK